MKIGVCFSGQLRAGGWAIPAIKSFIGDLWKDCDFFVHTWESQYNKNYSHECIVNLSNLMSTSINYTNPNRPIWSPIGTEDLNRFLTTYNPKVSLIEDYNTTITDISRQRHDCIVQHNLQKGQEYFPPAMYYSYYRSVEMLQQYEQQHGFNYDIIVKLRPDIIFPMSHGAPTYHYKRAELAKDIEKVISNPNRLYHTQDVYWVSTGYTIKKINSFWEESFKTPNVTLWSYASNMGIEVSKSDIEFTLLRNLWKRIPVENYFMLDCFERFFLDLPPDPGKCTFPGSNFYDQHMTIFKSYIHNYSILKELCDETNFSIN